MPTSSDELGSYIKNALASGTSPEALRASLKVVGWSDGDVEKALVAAGAPASENKKFPWAAVSAISGAVILLAAAGILFLMSRKAPAAPPSSVGGNLPQTQAPLANGPLPPPPENPNPGDGASGQPESGTTADYADMVVPVANVSPLENAYLDPEIVMSLSSSSTAVPDLSLDDILSGKAAWNQAFADDVLGKNRPYISALANYVSRPGFLVPAWSDVFTIGIGAAYVDYSSLVKLAKIVALDVLNRERSGDYANGAAEALAVALYGQKMAISQINVAGYLAGLEIKGIGLEAFKKVISKNALSAEQAGVSDKVLAGFEDTAPSLERAFRINFWVTKARFEDILRDPNVRYPLVSSVSFRDPGLLDKNATIKMIAEAARARAKMAEQACGVFSDQPDPSVEELDALKKLESENSLGKLIFHTDLTEKGAPANEARCRDAALVSSVRALLNPSVKK